MAIPNEQQREVAISLKNLGVHLIIGSHPHVLQGHEWINNTLVHYSLGNFVFHPHFTTMGVSNIHFLESLSNIYFPESCMESNDVSYQRYIRLICRPNNVFSRFIRSNVSTSRWQILL